MNLARGCSFRGFQFSALACVLLVTMTGCGAQAGGGDESNTGDSAVNSDGTLIAKDGSGTEVALMDLPSPPLATVFTQSGTRVDFLQLEEGTPILVTEAGPLGALALTPDVIRRFPKDAVAQFSALAPGVVVPEALIQAEARLKATTAKPGDVEVLTQPKAEELAQAKEEDLSKRFTLSMSESGIKAAIGDVASTRQAVSSSSRSTDAAGNPLTCSATDLSLVNFEAFTACSSSSQRLRVINGAGDTSNRFAGISSTGDYVCTLPGGQYVSFRARVKPQLKAWSTRSDFAVPSGTGRVVDTWAGEIFNYDYDSTVYNVIPDLFNHGACGE